MVRHIFNKVSKNGNRRLCLPLVQEALKHLRAYEGTEICLRLNKNRTITLYKASVTDKQIQDIIDTLGLD